METPFSRLLSVASGVFGLRILGACVQLGAVAFVGIGYDIESLGLYGLIWTTAVIFRVSGAFGLDLMGMRTESVYWYRDEKEVARAYAHRNTVALSVIWGTLVVVCSLGILFAPFNFSYPRSFLILLVCVAAVSSIQRLWACQMRSAMKIKTGQFLESVLSPVLAICAIGASIWVSWFPLLWGQLMSLCALLPFYYFMNPLARGRRLSSGQIEKQDWKETIRLGISTLLTALSSRLGIFFTGMGSFHSTGVYEVSQRVQSVSSLTVSSFATVLLPTIGIEVAQGSAASLRRLIFRGTVLSAGFPLLVLAGHMLVGKPIIEFLFDDSLPFLWETTALLLGAALLNGATSILSNLLTMSGGGSKIAGIAIVQLLTLTVGVFALGNYDSAAVAGWVFASECIRSIMLVLVSVPMIRGAASQNPH